MPYFPAVGHIDDNLSKEEIQQEYRRRYSLAAYHRRRAELIARLGGVCSLCAQTEGLLFVRAESAPKTLRVNQLTTMAAKKLARALKHVRLVCPEHAYEHKYSDDKIKHGAYYAAYRRNCRCDECQEYIADYNLRRREDRRYAKYNTTLPPKFAEDAALVSLAEDRRDTDQKPARR